MNSFFGWTREKLGRTTYKAALMVPLGETNPTYPTFKPDLKTPFKPEAGKKIRCYRAIKGHYFKPTDKFWKLNKTTTYELHPENTSYEKGECHIQFINAETGAPISYHEIDAVTFTPQALTQVIAAEWVKQSVAANKGLNTGYLVLGMCAVAFLAIGFLLGTNIDSITQVVTGAAPTPTPIPPVYIVRPP